MSQEPEPRYEKIGRKDWPKGLLIDAGIVIVLVLASIFPAAALLVLVAGAGDGWVVSAGALAFETPCLPMPKLWAFL